MPVYVGSRYETASRQTVIDDNGISRDFVFGGHSITLDDLGLKTRVVNAAQGDFIDEYAYAESLKTRNWWVIAQVNNLDYPLPPLDDQDTVAQIVPNLPVIVPDKKILARF